MPFRCLRSSDPNIRNVVRLYDASDDTGDLYFRSDGATPPLCSSTSPPPPSTCVVCFDQFVHAVCTDLLEDVKLVMEGNVSPIDLIQSECPGLLRNDTWKWCLAVFLVVTLMIALSVVFCWKLRRCERTPKHLKEVASAVDSSEVEPVAEAAL